MPYAGIGRPRTFCSPRCRNWRHAHGDERPSWLDERHCGQCGVVVTSPDIRVRYCSPRCQKLAAAGSAVGTQRVCKFCDQTFTVTNGKQVYCSRACRLGYNRRFASASALRRTARRWRDADAERFTVLDIADRDGWVCGLCLGPIDPNIRGDRFRQVTVDHIVPLSRGGLHRFDNVQLAHWTCNAAKRDSIDVVTMSVPSEERRVIARWQEGQHPSPPTGEPAETRTRSRPV